MAKICQKIEKETRIPIFLCVQNTDLEKVVVAVDLPVWAQHIDPVKPFRATGYTTAYAVAKQGAKGTLLNHSEHPLEFSQLKLASNLAGKEGLERLIFVKTLQEAKKAARLKPEFLALEEPSLIAKKKAMVEVGGEKEKIKTFLKLNLKSCLLVGAGINSQKDVAESVRLGTKGVVVSSAVVLAKNPHNVLKDLAQGFKH